MKGPETRVFWEGRRFVFLFWECTQRPWDPGEWRSHLNWERSPDLPIAQKCPTSHRQDTNRSLLSSPSFHSPMCSVTDKHPHKLSTTAAAALKLEHFKSNTTLDDLHRTSHASQMVVCSGFDVALLRPTSGPCLFFHTHRISCPLWVSPQDTPAVVGSLCQRHS